jgi:hypothetical protein
VAATSCCDPAALAAPLGGSLAVAALSTAFDALDERRLVGTDVPDLSTLAGARSGTIGAALSTRRQEFELRPFETQPSEEATAYLKLEKPRFLFLEGSADAVVAADVATAALPDTSVDRLVVGAPAPAPGACSSAASAALGDGDAGSHLSGGPAPHHSLPLLPFPMTSTPRSPGERVPTACAAGTPHPSVPGAPAAGSFAPSYASLAHAPTAALRACARARGVGGSDRTAFTTTLCWEERSIRVTAARRGRTKEKGEAYSPAGRWGA